jgi:hypothetical protein
MPYRGRWRLSQPFSNRMTNSLCGENQKFWDEATQYIPESLQKRITLWNGAYQEIVQSRN